MRRSPTSGPTGSGAHAALDSLLVIEDDPNTRDILRLYLERAGFAVRCAADGQAGLDQALESMPALVVLDLMLPGVDGWSVCRRLRDLGDVPILILSARQEEEDRLLGLGLGADDYVVKPFSPREVVMRVQAILRRARREPAPVQQDDAGATQVLGSGPVRLDPDERRVTVYGREVTLTPSEYRLLHAMMRRPGRTFDRSELLDHLYPTGGSAVPKAIDVHVGKLRQKIEPEPTQPRHLQTVRGFGYRFCEGDG